MSDQNFNINQKIKDKLDSHEFDFHPAAWDNMNGLLDGKRTPDKSYFKTKMIIAMTTLLFFLSLLLWQGDQFDSPQSIVHSPQSSVRSLERSERPELASGEGRSERPELASGPQSSVHSLQSSVFSSQSSVRQSAGTNNNQQTPDPSHSSFIIHHSSLQKDTSFFQKIAARLTSFNQHYAPEKVYLQFDRSFFEPGEAIWFNAFVRDANSLKASGKSEILYAELLAPNGSVLNKITLLAKGGTAAGDFQLDATAPGGIYKIKAYTNWQRNTDDAFERDIQVQASVLPRLRMELEFQRKAYGPGDRVEAKLNLNTLANEALARQEFTALASLDGQRITEVKGTTDGGGRALIKFDLPKDLATNDGLLNVLIAYNGQTESISRSLPIVLNKIYLQFLPEGGDMVAGLPSSVAFKALDEFGKPADVEGKIFNSKGVEISTFRSFHQGMGAFDFTPATGEAYSARLTKPEGIKEVFQLPEAMPRGFSLKVMPPLASDTLQVEISSTEDEALNLALVSRGDIYFSQTLRPVAGTHLVKIPTAALPIGVAQVTLFDSKEIPRAERLVFLNPDKKLKVEIKTDKEQYLPREKVQMSVKVTDERGLPMPGQYSLAVVDDNLLTFADDKQGHILSHLLLESELAGEVEEPNFYFDPKEKHPEKNQLLALDYLMMTQGWRRFSWEDLLWERPVAMEIEGERAVTKGRVVDYMNRPIPGIVVKVDGTKQFSTTDADGYFMLDTLFSNLRFVLEMNNKRQAMMPYAIVDGYRPIIKTGINYNPQNPQLSAVILKEVGKAGYASIQGTLKDSDNGQTIIFGTVAVYKDGVLYSGTETDLDGYYSLSELDPGKYDLVFSYTGYNESKVENVFVNPGKAYQLNGNLSTGINLTEVVVTYERPIIEQDNTTQSSSISFDRPKATAPRQRQGKVKSKEKQAELVELGSTTQGAKLSSEEIKNLPTRDVNALASLGAGVASQDEGEDLVIRGSRNDATNYYIDGVRVSGRMIPKPDIEQMPVVVGGTPAQFANGDDMAKNQGSNFIGILPKRSEKTEQKKLDTKQAVAPGGNKAIAKNEVVVQSFYTPRQFYAPKYEADHRSSTNEQRSDFRKTAFWEPKLTVGRNGKATVEFYTPDAITTYRATIEGIGMDGSIGRGEQRFFTQMPFGMDVKIPTHLLTGDRLILPLTLVNNTQREVSGQLAIAVPEHFTLIKKLPETLTLKAGETKTIYPEYEIGFAAKGGAFQVAFRAEGLQDAFAERIEVQPRGFPVSQVFGGNEKEKTFQVAVDDPVEGSLQAAFTVHPNVLSDLSAGMERMLRQPSGCFEQTSSGNYPNLLVLDYLKTSGDTDPAIETQANQFLDYGYKRLLTFEVKGGGFDWYGNPPAHEALTAYGLMQFVDMKAVYPVDENLIDRTAKWLLSRRDGKGSWNSDRPGLHSWHQKSPIADAYITWALVEAGFAQKIPTEIAKVLKDAHETQDPYIIALAANICLKMKDKKADELLTLLIKSQTQNGSWTGKSHSMTQSTGQNLTVETTALAALALLKSNGHTTSAQAAINYLATAKSPYGFGSTQATVLALKALTAHAQEFKKSIGGTVALFVNGQKAGEQSFTADQQAPIAFHDLTKFLNTGKNEVKVKFTGGETLPYDLSIQYSTRQPQSSPDCKLNLQTSLVNEERSTNNNQRMGATVRLTTVLSNRSKEAVPNPIALVGIPAGLSLQPWQLKEMQEKQLCDYYEIWDGYVVFYFRQMDAGEVKTIHLDLKADLPGEYEAPASSAYLYYANDAVVWSKPDRVVIGVE